MQGSHIEGIAMVTDFHLLRRLLFVSQRLPERYINFGTSALWGNDLYSMVLVSVLFAEVMQFVIDSPPQTPLLPWFAAPLSRVLAHSYRKLNIRQHDSSDGNKLSVSLNRLCRQDQLLMCNDGTEMYVATSVRLLTTQLDIAESLIQACAS